MLPQASERQQRLQLEEARNGLSPREGGRERWLCQHLDFRLLVSRTVREQISVVVSLRACGKLLQQPWETDTGGWLDAVKAE